MLNTNTTEGDFTRFLYKHSNDPIALVVALDQQIIENGVLHSTRVTSLVSLHLLTVSKWMSRKSRCLAASPATLSFLLSFRSARRKSFLEEEVLPLSQNVFPRLGREKNRCEKKRNATMRSPFTKDIEGKGGSIEMTVEKKGDEPRHPEYRN